MRKILTALLIISLFSCNDEKKHLSDLDKIELINKTINSTELYNNLSEIYRDSVPTIVTNKLITKKILSKVTYNNLSVYSSDKDSTDLNKWKSDWLHPKFYISFEEINLIENKVFIVLRVRSTGVLGKLVFEFKEKKWILINQTYGKT
jgi:hypothetical protein